MLMLATPSLQWLCHRFGENLRAQGVSQHTKGSNEKQNNPCISSAQIR